MAKNRGGGGGWRALAFDSFWNVDGRSERGFIFQSRPTVIAKRRWADKILREEGLDPGKYLRHEIPGTNLVLFTPSPLIAGEIELTPEFVKRQRAQRAELNAILDVPIEEADGTTVPGERPVRKGSGGD